MPAGSSGLGAIHEEVKRLFSYVTASPLRDEAQPILVPGQFERETMAKRSRDGIPVSVSMTPPRRPPARRYLLSAADPADSVAVRRALSMSWLRRRCWWGFPRRRLRRR